MKIFILNDRSQTQKATYYMIPIYEISRIGQQKVDKCLPKARGSGTWIIAVEYRVFWWGDGCWSILEVGNGDGCTVSEY